jgi:hypothetical protein
MDPPLYLFKKALKRKHLRKAGLKRHQGFERDKMRERAGSGQSRRPQRQMPSIDNFVRSSIKW